MTGVVSHWHFTTETWVLSLAICVEFVAETGIEPGFSAVTSFLSLHYYSTPAL